MISLILWGISLYEEKKLTSNLSVSPPLLQAPNQTPTEKKSFEIQKQGQTYKIDPVNEYELWGLVVSLHNSDGWDDYDHEQWKDFLNTKDICVIWGENATSPFLKDFTFSHGQFTCYVKTSKGEAWSSFRQNQFSNNHLIPANESVAEFIRDAKVGDEIHFKGQLVNYAINGARPRVTSTTREDTGPGACEIVYVDQFEIMARHNRKWNYFKNLTFTAAVLFASGALFSIFILPALSTGMGFISFGPGIR